MSAAFDQGDDTTHYQIQCEVCMRWSRSTIKRQETKRYLCDDCHQKKRVPLDDTEILTGEDDGE